MNKKTKRHSPPPFQTSTIDSKISDNFSKWAKILQLISPPNKKRRSVSILSQQDTWPADEKHVTLLTATKKQDIQKKLNRRAMYIPNTTVTDGPKDAMHQWHLYKSTHQKLRQNALPLSETIHLRKMLLLLQPVKTSNSIKQEEDDDIPLGTLLEKNKLAPTSNPTSNYPRYSATTHFYHNHMPSYFQPQPYLYYNKIVQFV
ncbi:hypothetical protein BDF21DRAFT_433365 [Thamnidium elegans]|uniref:Uncharacterized protein n=1 Tax=Thamnidium elegans TaxID=101142 RepID=A0A8H7SHV6_9FUNG|nr:hypothetical protein INT48_007019 [Thamnidium elegans]KAI8048420.1 hypothetical protein BDF21DRAFT_433365 [Thamnidium elegans]